MAVSQNLYLTQLSQNIASNSSTVRITLTSTQEGSSWNGYDRTGYYYISINGGGETAYSFTTTLPKNSTITCFSTDVTVPHNADGTGSISVRTSLDTGIAAGTVTTSNAITLTTIPRTSVPTLSAGSVEFGQDIIIYTNRAASSFIHLLYYSINGADDVMLGWVEDNCTWTVPLSLMNNIPSATAATITIKMFTFSDSTLIGGNTVSFTAYVPASVVPSISALATADPTGCLGKYGAYVQYKSTCKITATASGAYSSTITAYRITANGATYTSNGSTTGALNTAGNNTITCVVTDSRGRTASKSIAISVIGYSNPIISKMQVIRCNADGSANNEGAYAKVTMAGVITSLNSKNAKSFRLEYKETSSPTWTELQTYSVYSLNENKVVSCNTDKSYDFRLVATDDFASTTYANKIGTIYVLIDYKSTGKGIAFGKVSEKDAFECALPAEFNSSVAISNLNGYTPITSGNIGSQGVHYATSSHYMRTFSDSGTSHGEGWLMQCRHNLEGDNRFKIFCGDGSVHTKVDHANSSDSVPWSGVTGKPTLVGSYSDGTFCYANTLLTFRGSNTALVGGEKGNYLFSISAWSDSRLKKNIKESKVNALDTIKKIQLKEYDFIDEKFGKHHDIGYIAHELQEVVPECVFEVEQDKEIMGFDSLLQVNDTPLIPYLVKAIQEQQKEIEELKKLLKDK